MTSPRQLVLDLGFRPALGAEDFLVGQSNAAAVALIDQWPDWQANCAIVVGPGQSGKSHLANVWRHKSGAGRVQARDLAEDDVSALSSQSALVVEDLDAGIGSERALFHLLNLAREHRWSLLATSAVAPGELSVSLPDLRSRLRAGIVVEIEPPDDGLLGAVLVKHFADRQLAVEPAVIGYLVTNIERTMASAAAVVDEIDRRALASKRRVTRALAGEVIGNGRRTGQRPN